MLRFATLSHFSRDAAVEAPCLPCRRTEELRKRGFDILEVEGSADTSYLQNSATTYFCAVRDTVPKLPAESGRKKELEKSLAESSVSSR